MRGWASPNLRPSYAWNRDLLGLARSMVEDFCPEDLDEGRFVIVVCGR